VRVLCLYVHAVTGARSHCFCLSKKSSIFNNNHTPLSGHPFRTCKSGLQMEVILKSEGCKKLGRLKQTRTQSGFFRASGEKALGKAKKK